MSLGGCNADTRPYYSPTVGRLCHFSSSSSSSSSRMTGGGDNSSSSMADLLNYMIYARMKQYISYASYKVGKCRS